MKRAAPLRTLYVTPPLSAEREAALGRTLGGHWRIVGAPGGMPIEANAGAVGDAHAVVTMGWPAEPPPAPQLELLQLIGAGYDGVHFAAVPARASVCNVFEHEIGIAEYIVLALLEWQIRLGRQDAALREGRWIDGFAMDRPPHGELYGKTVGFVGYGHIAAATARRLAPFGVRIAARTRSPQRCDAAVHDAGGMDDLASMLSVSDYVIVTAPLTPATHGLVDAGFLGAMQRDAVIVNVARGGLIEEQALFDALAQRRIGGAVIDTWYRYPALADGEQACAPANLPFHALDNIIMTPHSSGWTTGLLDRRWSVIVRNLQALTDGAPLVNVLKAPGGDLPSG